LVKNSGIHIGIYTDTALPKLGGQEIVVDALARQFVGLGHRVTLLAPRPRLPLRPDDKHLPYRVVRHPRFYSTRRLVSAYRWFLLRLFARHRFDLLHCHGVCPPGYLAALCKDRLNVPIVLTSHGGDLYEKNRRLNNPILRRRFELAVRSADRLVAISEFTRQGFLRLGADESRIVNIPNGVDFDELSTAAPRPAEMPADLLAGRYFLFIGRLVPQKGLPTLLHAMAQLGPIPADIRVAIAGAGDERGMLQTLCQQLHLEERVRFVGPVCGAVRNYLFQNCICTMVPSRLWEAFGLVVIESYAAGRPVITTRHPGLADLVEEGATGYVVDPESPAQMGQAMRRMIEDRAASDEMGRHAQRKAQDFSWQRIARRHLELYEGLLRQ
jgi:glycosyltransferase involved in cell wall biosynthesis